MSLATGYAIQKRNKMSKGGEMNCAHGGPAYCNKGCYAEGGERERMADGGIVAEMNPNKRSKQSEDSADSEKQGRAYEKRDEPMNELANIPIAERPFNMSSEESDDVGDMEDEDEPMKMARGGMFNPKSMVRMMMASGGMVNSSAALKEAYDSEMAKEKQPSRGADNEDIDIYQTTPHDDFLSDESQNPLVQDEGYEEGHQAKQRRRGGLLERVMSKLL